MFRNRIWLRSLFKKEALVTKKSRIRINDSTPIPIASGRVDESVSRKRKTEQSIVDSHRDTVKKRRKTSSNNVTLDRISDHSSDCSPDRISDLPEPIIHLIFSSMKCTKDVARTTILSKQWKNNFNSYLTFDFDERWFKVPKQPGKHNRIKARELQKRKFKSYVDRSLRTRLEPVPCIDKFRLHVNKTDEVLRACMDRWVCSALSRNVKEIDLQVDTKGKNFVLPDGVLMSQHITSLKLLGSIVCGFSNISLSNLRQLSIKESTVASDAVIKKFEMSCPLLEDLRLVSCVGIIILSISSLLKLKRVEVHECVNAISIEIASPSLETFLYQGDKNHDCNIDLKGSANLRNLTLRKCTMTDMVFQDFVSKYPLIEKLELQKCRNIERVTVLSNRLRSLVLFECVKLKEVNIDVPNLHNIEFYGHKMPFSSVNVLGLRNAKFSFGPVLTADRYMAEYQQLFRSFDRSKGFRLILYSKQCMKIFDEPSEASEVLQFFKELELTASITNVLKAVDNWLRERHGRNIALISPSSELITLMQTMITEREANPSCCSFYSNKCWRHYVEDVKVLKSNYVNKMHYDFKWKSRRITPNCLV